MPTTLEAHFDGKTIVLDEPFELKPEMKIIVTIVGESDEREDWRLAGKQSFAKAYADDEPKYDLSLIKEKNPDYEGN